MELHFLEKKPNITKEVHYNPYPLVGDIELRHRPTVEWLIGKTFAYLTLCLRCEIFENEDNPPKEAFFTLTPKKINLKSENGCCHIANSAIIREKRIQELNNFKKRKMVHKYLYEYLGKTIITRLKKQTFSSEEAFHIKEFSRQDLNLTLILMEKLAIITQEPIEASCLMKHCIYHVVRTAETLASRTWPNRTKATNFSKEPDASSDKIKLLVHQCENPINPRYFHTMPEVQEIIENAQKVLAHNLACEIVNNHRRIIEPHEQIHHLIPPEEVLARNLTLSMIDQDKPDTKLQSIIIRDQFFKNVKTLEGKFFLFADKNNKTSLIQFFETLVKLLACQIEIQTENSLFHELIKKMIELENVPPERSSSLWVSTLLYFKKFENDPKNQTSLSKLKKSFSYHLRIHNTRYFPKTK